MLYQKEYTETKFQMEFIFYSLLYFICSSRRQIYIQVVSSFREKFHCCTICTLLVKNRIYSIFALLHITYCNVAAYIFRNAKHYNKHSCFCFFFSSQLLNFLSSDSWLSVFLWQYHKIELLDFRIRSYSYTTANKRAKLFQL